MHPEKQASWYALCCHANEKRSHECFVFWHISFFSPRWFWYRSRPLRITLLPLLLRAPQSTPRPSPNLCLMRSFLFPAAKSPLSASVAKSRFPKMRALSIAAGRPLLLDFGLATCTSAIRGGTTLLQRQRRILKNTCRRCSRAGALPPYGISARNRAILSRCAGESKPAKFPD